MKHWIDNKTFSEKYGLDRNSINVLLNQGRSNEFIKSENGAVYVDENFLIKKQDYKKKLYIVAHDYYYYFVYVLGTTSNQLAKALSKREYGTYTSYSTYFSQRLFCEFDNRIMSHRPSKALEKFVEFCEKYIPQIHKRYKNKDWYQDRLKDLI